MAILTIKSIKTEALKVLERALGSAYNVPPDIEYHARRTDEDPKVWKVVEVHKRYGDIVETKELATDLKRNRAQALVKLLRSNQKQES